MKLTNFLFNTVMVFVVLIALLPADAPVYLPYALAPSLALAGGTLAVFAPSVGAFAPLQRAVWSKHIVGNLYASISFLNFFGKPEANSFSPDSRVIYVQNAGEDIGFQKNRKNLPATIKQREDKAAVYLLNDFSTDPFVITYTDGNELSPEYRESVIGGALDNMKDGIANDQLTNLVSSPVYESEGATVLPSKFILGSTGADGENNSHDMNTHRKITTQKDLQRMRKMFMDNNAWTEGKMFALLTTQQEMELFPADSVVTATQMQSVSEAERRNGVMYKCQGWSLMTRSSVMACAANGDILVPGEVLAADADLASIFWNQALTEFHMTDAKPFLQKDAPTFYGDVFSFMLYSGGRPKRKDYKGIGLLKQAKTA